MSQEETDPALDVDAGTKGDVAGAHDGITALLPAASTVLLDALVVSDVWPRDVPRVGLLGILAVGNEIMSDFQYSAGTEITPRGHIEQSAAGFFSLITAVIRVIICSAAALENDEVAEVRTIR